MLSREKIVRGGLILTLGAVAASACSASSGGTGSKGSGGTSSGGLGGSGSGATGAVGGFGGASTGGDSGSSIVTDSGMGATMNVPDGDDCTGVSEQATNKPAPVDVIWAVDTSDSMLNELAAVEVHLNNFYNIVFNSGVDIHVVMLGKRGRPGDTSGFLNPDAGFCINPPLGGGGCPGADDNLPVFLHVPSSVGSVNALDQMLAQYPTYKQVLRQHSLKYFAVVTDDEAQMGAAAFTQGVNALEPGWFDQWKFFGVFCTGSCGTFLACTATGSTYLTLTSQTGTTPGDLCGGQQDFGPVFNQLAQTILSGKALACEWDIPPPPPPEMLNPQKVNVDYTPGGSSTPQPLYNVADAAACGPMGGWYYDNNLAPTKIFVCPASCQYLSVDIMGKIDIKFGCDTLTVPK